MKVTAAIDIRIPVIIFEVSGSLNTAVPMRMAVIGSNTPSTEALVAPMLRVATANVAVDTIVGRRARPVRLSHAPAESRPAVIPASPDIILNRNITAPTERVQNVSRLLDTSLMVLLRLIMTMNRA